MRNRCLVVVTFIGWLAAGLEVNAKAMTDKVYTNETAITFTANSGDSTDAYAGYLRVPENRHNPASRDIRLNYVRFAATGKRKGPPIVYLAGGPGGSGIGTAKWRRFPLFMAMREFGDVIALDQRGTGQSEQPENCQSSQLIGHDKILHQAAVKQLYRGAATECLAKWQGLGIDVYGYTTEQNAWDIDALRQHLEAEKVVLWGISYGSHLALAAIKQFPQRIDKVVIASAEGLNQTVKLPAETDAYFARVQEVIDQQPLKQQVPDLVALMTRVHARLDVEPIALEMPTQAGGTTKILVQSHHLKALASSMIADPNQYLAMLIHMYLHLDAGNTQLLAGILQRGMFNNDPIGFRLMSLAMDVASGITDERLALVEAQAQTSLLGDQLNFPMPLLNNIDAKLDLGDEFRKAPKSDIPTLLLTGSLDGRTYPTEQLAAVRGFSNLTQVTVKYAGHNLFMSSPKVQKTMAQFLSGEKIAQTLIELPLPDLSLKR